MTVAVALLLAFALGEGAGASATPEGLWETRDAETGQGRSLVRIEVKEGRLAGVVVKVFPRPGEDPDPVCTRCRGVRHGQRVVGMQILWGHHLQDGRWRGGTVLDPENGKEYASTLWIESGGQLRMRGHWGPFYRTETWRRVSPDEAQR